MIPAIYHTTSQSSTGSKASQTAKQMKQVLCCSAYTQLPSSTSLSHVMLPHHFGLISDPSLRAPNTQHSSPHAPMIAQRCYTFVDDLMTEWLEGWSIAHQVIKLVVISGKTLGKHLEQQNLDWQFNELIRAYIFLAQSTQNSCT